MAFSIVIYIICLSILLHTLGFNTILLKLIQFCLCETFDMLTLMIRLNCFIDCATTGVHTLKVCPIQPVRSFYKQHGKECTLCLKDK